MHQIYIKFSFKMRETVLQIKGIFLKFSFEVQSFILFMDYLVPCCMVYVNSLNQYEDLSLDIQTVM